MTGKPATGINLRPVRGLNQTLWRQDEVTVAFPGQSESQHRQGQSVGEDVGGKGGGGGGGGERW